jgi:hypothetical protein
MTALDEAPTFDGALGAGLAELAQLMVAWLETGERPEAMFADDVFADLTVPQWRIQAEGADGAFHLREDSHPQPGRVRVEALDRTARGFLLQLEERWDDQGQQWYCRELMHCVVTDGLISQLAIYCTGDWDEALQRRHAEQVRLIRP